METKAIGIAAIVLAIGLAGGYWLGGRETPNAHGMPDGTSMSDTMGGMVSGLEGKSGDEFDKAFIEEMIAHHEGAVAMAERLLKNTKRQELQKLGNDIISAQTHEIEMMRGWLEDWY